MFIFIVPLRSPETCSDWRKVSLLCNETLQSLTQQDSNKYRVILVCNEPPLDFVEHENINVVQELFSIPKSWDEGIGDIYQKVKRGMVEVKRLQIIDPNSLTFVMRVDADDLVSNRIVSFAEKYPDSDGWYFNTGYVYDIGKKYLFLRPKFTAISGTSNILKCTYTDFPDSIDTPSSEWLEPVWQHLNINKFLKPRGRELNSLPFPGAIYRINPQNMSATHVKDARFSSLKSVLWKVFFKRKITGEIISEFTLPCIESL
jgi:hypothetical protein